MSSRAIFRLQKKAVVALHVTTMSRHLAIGETE